MALRREREALEFARRLASSLRFSTQATVIFSTALESYARVPYEPPELPTSLNDVLGDSGTTRLEQIGIPAGYLDAALDVLPDNAIEELRAALSDAAAADYAWSLLIQDALKEGTLLERDELPA